MDLQELNNLIHTATKTELQTNLAAWKAEIKSILELGREEDETYFISHTGRELFRKLYNFGLESEIKDDYDSGFQPISVKRFNPKSINTVAWYDASDTSTITQSGSGITKWLDKSGKGNDLTPLDISAGALNHSIQENSLNGLSTLSLDSDDYFMKEKALLPTPSGNVNVFIVAKILSVSHGSDSIFSLEENTAGEGVMDFQLDAGSTTQYKGRLNCKNAEGSDGANTIRDSGADYTNQWAIFSAVFDFDGTSRFLSYVNGINLGDKPYTNKMTGGNSVDPTELKVFANRAAVRSPEGNIAEVLYCENSSNDTREKIEGYLAYKWGLVSELDGAHAYKDVTYKSFNP